MPSIYTIHGPLDEALLEKREGYTADGYWVEYWQQGTLVHRSVTLSIGDAGIPFDEPDRPFDRYGKRWKFA